MGNAIDLHARSSRNHAGNGRKNGLSAGVSDFRSLHGDIVIRSLLARLSPATKIPFQTRRARK
jgi:hypothetical protein